MDRCGLGAEDCLPPPIQRNLSSGWTPARCPPRCTWQPEDKSRVWGSAPVYRPDSYLCKAAIHAGVVGAAGGGCFAYREVAPAMTPGFDARSAWFVGTEGPAGTTSRSFPSWFPRGVQFVAYEAGDAAHCEASPWGLLVANLLLLAVWVLLGPSPAAFYFVLLEALYWYCLFALDETLGSGGWAEKASLTGLGTQIPFVATSAVLFHLVCRRTVPADLPRFAVDALLFYAIPAFVAVHLNLFAYVVPDVDLTVSSLAANSGNMAVGIILLVVVLAGASLQARVLFKADLLRAHVAGAAAGALVAGLVWAFGESIGYTIHVHHLLFALALLPFTKGVTRPAMIFQGALLGIFVNGAVIWGTDASMLEAIGLRVVSNHMPEGRPDALWTGINSTATTVSLAWDHATTLNCSWASPANASNGTNHSRAGGVRWADAIDGIDGIGGIRGTNGSNGTSGGGGGGSGGGYPHGRFVPRGCVSPYWQEFERKAQFKLYMNGVMLLKGYKHSFVVTGLQPQSQYFFRLWSSVSLMDPPLIQVNTTAAGAPPEQRSTASAAAAAAAGINLTATKLLNVCERALILNEGGATAGGMPIGKYYGV